MSHYSAIPLEILDGKTLIETLKLFGFEAECTLNLEHLATLKGEALTAYLKQNAKHLTAYNREVRQDTAHIIVSRRQIQPGANDLGFSYDGKKWSMTISDYDAQTGRAEPNGISRVGLGPNFRYRLMNEYARLTVLAQAQALGQTAVVEKVGNGYRVVVKQPDVKTKAKAPLMSTAKQRTGSKLQSRF